jgi:hypothetical protein
MSIISAKIGTPNYFILLNHTSKELACKLDSRRLQTPFIPSTLLKKAAKNRQ